MLRRAANAASALLAMFVATTACWPTAGDQEVAREKLDPSHNTEMVQLKGKRLSDAIFGRTCAWAEMVHDGLGSQTFRKDGSWEGVGGWGSPSGQYTVHEDRICIRLDRVEEESCYHFYRQGKKRLFMKDVEVETPMHAPFQEISCVVSRRVD